MRVTHVTGYTYSDTVGSSYNEARMTPVTGPGQLVLSSRLDVRPSPWTFKYRDYWGSLVTAFEVHEPHHELLVTATSSVQVDRAAPTPRRLDWDAMADPAVVDEFCELLQVTDRTRPEDDLTLLLASLRADAEDPTAFAQAVCALVQQQMEYEHGTTEVHGTTAEAWTERRGVCQDFAHVCLGALREAGIPARYVSGYLHPSAEPVVGETVAGESHAWIEWWDGTWVAFDPTNATAPDDRYVVVGSGRDYVDVAPLTGIFTGGETSAMFVEVTLTRSE